MIALRDFSTSQRVQTPYHHIDPGFINYRLIFSVFGRSFVEKFNNFKQPEVDHWSKLANDHLIVDLALTYCRKQGVKSLGEVLKDNVGSVFCSTEEIEGAEDVYEDGRKSVKILLPYEYAKEIIMTFSTRHFVADTGRAEVAEGSKASIIGIVRETLEDRVVLWPLIIGAPSFDHQFNKDFVIEPEELVWYGWDWFQIFPEDIT